MKCYIKDKTKHTHTTGHERHTESGLHVLTFLNRATGEKSKTPKKQTNFPLWCIAGQVTPCCSIWVKVTKHWLFEVFQKHQTGTGLLVFPWQHALLWRAMWFAEETQVSSVPIQNIRSSRKPETKVENASRYFFHVYAQHSMMIHSLLTLKLKHIFVFVNKVNRFKI